MSGACVGCAMRVIAKKGIRLVVLSVLLLVSACDQPTPIILIDGAVKIFGDSKNAAENKGEPIYLAQRGDSFLISSCDVVSKRFVLEVEIRNDVRGYVSHGDYRFLGDPDC